MFLKHYIIVHHQILEFRIYGEIMRIIIFSKKHIFFIIFTFAITFLFGEFIHNHSFTGDISTEQHISLDYKPKLQYSYIINDYKLFDLVGIFDFQLLSDFENIEYEHELYRAWIRYCTAQTETRIGRQKINFGPAKILRNLRWFDTINHLDPRGESEGVSALLSRYYFLNNSNIWVWGIFGSNELKGNETIAGQENTLEPGFRIQIPFKNSELAFSYHNRKRADNLYENRLGLDIFCDYYLGMWSELSTTITADSIDYLLTFGTDYTFPILSGLHLLAENNTDWQADEVINISAVMIDLPIGLLDSISLTGLYNYQENISRFALAWQRSYDRFSFNLSTLISDSNNESERDVKLILAYDF